MAPGRAEITTELRQGYKSLSGGQQTLPHTSSPRSHYLSPSGRALTKANGKPAEKPNLKPYMRKHTLRASNRYFGALGDPHR